MITRRNLLASSSAVLASPGAGAASRYVNGPITILVAFGPGSATDLQARAMAIYLAGDDYIGQPIIIENRAGANGAIAAEAIAFRTKPDGSAISAFTNGVIGLKAMSQPSPAWDPRRLTPISGMARNTQLLVVSPKRHTATTVEQLIRYATDHPGVVDIGVGNTSGVIAEVLFKKTAKIDALQIPYKAGGEKAVVNSLLGGHIGAAIVLTPACLELVRANELVALAIIDSKRFPGLPDIPAITEVMHGMEDLVAIAPRGTIVGPPGLPVEIAEHYSERINKVLGQRSIVEVYETMGSIPDPMTREEHRSYIEEQTILWERVVRDHGIKLL